MEVTEKNRTKYRMPGEFEPHEGCVMIWPERPGSWNYGAREAQKAFVKVAEAIGESEKVYRSLQKIAPVPMHTLRLALSHAAK